MWRTAVADLRGVVRVAIHRRHPDLDPTSVGRPELPTGMGTQLVRFAGIGTVCTLLYVLGYLALRPEVGPWWGNATALASTMVLNTAANRRLTFGRKGRRNLVRHYLESGVTFLVGLGVSSAALALVRTGGPGPGPVADTLALLASGTVATVLRFLLMRNWVFHPGRD